MNKAQIKKQIQDALKSLALSHSQAPGSPTSDGCASVFLEDGREARVDLITQAESGLSQDELADFFNKDQQRNSRPFSHPRIESEDEELFDEFGGVPFHAQSLGFHSDLFIPTGVEVEDTFAKYCLLARKRGKLVGMVLFRVKLLNYADFDWDEPSMADMLSLCLDIHLDLVYVCSRYRNKGYGKALACSVSNVFYDEVLHISKQLAPVAKRIGQKFELQTSLQSEWASRTGKLIHMHLMDELEVAIEEHYLSMDAEPEREALKLLELEEDADY